MSKLQIHVKLIFFILRWYLTDWNECSKTCGNGSHSRHLYCRKQINDSYYEELEESACDISTKPKVSLFQRCNEILCPAEWNPLPWSEVKLYRLLKVPLAMKKKIITAAIKMEIKMVR